MSRPWSRCRASPSSADFPDHPRTRGSREDPRPAGVHLIANTHAHELHTAEEMWAQSAGRIDVFVDFAGSGGTFAGCAKALKAHKPDLRCYLVEPEGAALFAGLPITNPNHKIQGGGYNRDLPLVDPALIDGAITVSNDEAGSDIVLTLNDSGLKYLSTDLFDDV